MRIHHVKLKNYRQYRDANIQFSTDPERNFTIIQGSNGAGKSNLLNAITWCLYREERHFSQEDKEVQLPLVNETVYHQLRPGEQDLVEVEVALGEDDVEYLITRQAKVYCQTDGTVSVREDEDPQVMFRSRDSWHTSQQPTYAIKSLLPADISHFFFFDGEQLDTFFQEDSAARVKAGIVDVSQINLLDQTVDHLEKVRTRIRRTAQGISPQIDSLNEEIEQTERDLEAARKRLKLLYRDQRGLQENLEEIRQQLRNSAIEEVRQWQETRDRLDDQITDYERQLDLLIEQAAAGLRETGPRVYAYPALQAALERIQARVDLDELPPKVRAPFFRDLLAQERCVCGRELVEGTAAWNHVHHRLEEISYTEYENAALEGKFKINDIIQGIPRMVEKQRALGRQIHDMEKAVEESRKQLRELSEKIRKYGELNLEEIEVLEEQHRQYEVEEKKNDREIGREQAEEERLERELERLNRQLQQALQESQRKKNLHARLELCNEALEVLHTIRTEMLTEVRTQIEQKTEAYFLELIWKKGTYKRVEIDEDYQISVLNVRDLPSLGTLSAGERQVLALAFMAALGTVSGFDAPVVIDTPIGRISGEPRANIADSLPHYLAGTQVTLLMTDTEYTEPVQVRLNTRIGKEYKLVFHEEKAETEVIAR